MVGSKTRRRPRLPPYDAVLSRIDLRRFCCGKFLEYSWYCVGKAYLCVLGWIAVRSAGSCSRICKNSGRSKLLNFRSLATWFRYVGFDTFLLNLKATEILSWGICEALNKNLNLPGKYDKLTEISPH